VHLIRMWQARLFTWAEVMQKAQMTAAESDRISRRLHSHSSVAAVRRYVKAVLQPKEKAE